MIKLLILTLFMMTNLYAYTIAVYTDEPDYSGAKKVIKTMRETYPFNQFEIDFKIVKITSSDLNCNPTPSIPRLVVCDSSKQRNHARNTGVDQALIVSNLPQYGGSGGGVPVITAESPPRMMLHEYLHTLGLCDEYEYSQSEADYYCPYMDGKPNVAIINPFPSYATDIVARSKHMKQVPWRNHIETSTKITQGSMGSKKLGTGKVNNSVASPLNDSDSPAPISKSLGLYKGTSCSKATQANKYTLWHPGYEKTIMKDLSVGLGRANELIVKDILESRGVGFKETAMLSSPPPDVNDNSLSKDFNFSDKNDSSPSKGSGAISND